MSLRIPLSPDQTLQTEFHEIERRLRRLEKQTGIKVGGTTIQVLGSGSQYVNLTSIIQRIEALEEALKNLPEPEEYDVFGAVGPASHEGLVPDPGVRPGPTGIAHHLLTEDAEWGFPLRGLVQVVTPGDETNGQDHIGVSSSLGVQGDLTAHDAEFNDVAAYGLITGDIDDPVEIESDGTSYGNVDAINFGPGLDVKSEPNLSGSLAESLYGYWPLDESSGTRVNAIGTAPDLLESGGTVPSAEGKFGQAASGTETDTFALVADIPATLSVSSGFSVATWVYFPAWVTAKPKPIVYLYNTPGISTPSFSIERYFDSDFLNVGFNWSGGSVSLPIPRLGPLVNDSWHLIVVRYNATSGMFTGQVSDGCIQDKDDNAGALWPFLKLTATVPNASLAAANAATFNALALFKAYSGSYDNFGGRIDALQIWTKCLTDSEVARLWLDSRGTVVPAESIAHRGVIGLATEEGQTALPYDVLSVNAGLHVGSVTAATIEVGELHVYGELDLDGGVP